MRRLFAFLTALCLCAGLLCGCAPAQPAAEGLSVVCTVFPAYDFVREIAGDAVNLRLLIEPGKELHTFDPTPRDMAAVAGCDLFVYVGGESDGWAETLCAETQGTSLAMMSLVSELCAAGDGHDHDHGEYDEHIWTSPKMAAEIVCGISDALQRLDPANAAEYAARTEAYVDKLSGLSAELAQTVAAGSRRELIFGDRFPMLYFTEELGLTADAAFPGCSSETEPSAAKLAALIDRVRREKIPVVLKCELSSGVVAEAIAEAGGARVMTLHSCHNVTVEEWERGESYLSLMRANILVLSEALK
ncbi:MAG: zinc ABC transporter substrate-binding protein [Clostridia bacterium]|nr:zinc ABC transporter substrate-binding protein [Clostridia bacterium]